jgi:hypothetical protein
MSIMRLNPTTYKRSTRFNITINKQLSLVILFSALFPLAPLLAFLNNVFEIRSDAYKYLFLYKRANPERAQNLGSWFSIIKFLSIVSITTNSIIVAFLSQSFEDIYLVNLDPSDWFIARIFVVIVWHLVVNFTAALISHNVRDCPKLVQIARTREIMMERYLLHGNGSESYEELSALEPVMM